MANSPPPFRIRLLRRARGLIDAMTMAFVGTGSGNRLVRYLAYQRKRKMRRVIEQHLESEGQYGNFVKRGPFEGLQYPPREEWASCRFEKIIGAYEAEIHPFLESILHEDFGVILNVGAAEGFYGVGLARMFEDSRVIAFEADPAKAEFLGRLAALNGVSDRIQLEGLCGESDFRELEGSPPDLLVCDIDGGEKDLLDPGRFPWLRDTIILLELHDCFLPGLSSLIRERFTPSHRIDCVMNAGLAYEEYPELHGLLFEEIYAMVGEDRRGLQTWFLMTPEHRDRA